MDVERFLRRIGAGSDWHRQIVHIEHLAARPARYAVPSVPLPDRIQHMLLEQHIERLYSHQVEALDVARSGAGFVITTGTASGKTLCYNLPIFERLLEEQEACALFIYPTKALAQDQLRGLLRSVHAMGLEATAGTYDGDTSPSTRRILRSDGKLLLTNPDMLHAGILPHHARWARFFEKLRFVVVDEIHTYRGVFGSNVAGVLQRLNRVCAHYGSHPLFLCSSATIANPQELAEKLTQQNMHLIEEDGSPRGEKRFVLWNPPLLDDPVAGTTPERRSALSDAQYSMVSLLEERIPVIAFVRTRVSAELLYRAVQDALSRRNASLANRVRAYRGGYLPEERREIERQLFSGELLGVISTNALELGIDIGSLEASVLVGYPGTIASTWQQAGRAGRGKEASLVLLVAHNAPVDQYLMNHPGYFFERSPEHAIIDPTNPHIAIGHLLCAAQELPVSAEESGSLFGEFTPALLEILADERHVRKVGGSWHFAQAGYLAAKIGLRNMDDVTYTIMDEEEGKAQAIGTLDEISAYSQLHTHAVYLHDGETYFVDKLDVDRKIAHVKREGVDYYTQSVSESAIVVRNKEREGRWRVSGMALGDVTVSLNVVMFKKIKFGSRDSIGYENLDLPTQTLDTSAFWLVPGASALEACRVWGRVPAEGLRGIANVLVEIVPLFVMADATDLGSVVDSSNFGTPSVFVYDKYPGGIGFSEKIFDWTEQIFKTSHELMSECPCQDGCPSCVGAPHPFGARDGAGERDIIPDKDAALVLLHHFLELPPYTPKERKPRVNAGDRALEDAPKPVPVRPLPPHDEAKVRARLQAIKRKKT
jgi:DEAD/DEAH box helicase domain-containing protein